MVPVTDWCHSWRSIVWCLVVCGKWSWIQALAFKFVSGCIIISDGWWGYKGKNIVSKIRTQIGSLSQTFWKIKNWLWKSKLHVLCVDLECCDIFPWLQHKYCTTHSLPVGVDTMAESENILTINQSERRITPHMTVLANQESGEYLYWQLTASGQIDSHGPVKYRLNFAT